MTENIAIYIATHKKIEYPIQNGYIPIWVGQRLNNNTFGYLADDEGINISLKNKEFCELTALYWIWKNDNHEIVGLVHYRRFFYNKIEWNRSYDYLSKNEILNLFNKYDLILPQKVFMFKNTVKTNYEQKHYIQDLDVCGEIIKTTYPDYYPFFDKLLNGHSYYPFNMLIAKKYIFDSYMEWLFSILDISEKRINYESYCGYNRRVFGFLAERLFNVWLMKNSQLKVKNKLVYNIENSFKMQSIKNIENSVKSITKK